jgi:hypothetical protein
VTRYAVRKLPDGGWFGDEYWPVEDRAFVGLTEVEFDTWETRAGAMPHLEVIGEPGDVTAIDVIVRSSARLEGWALRVRLVPTERGLRIVQREERERPPDVEEGVTLDTEGGVHPYERVTSREPMLLSGDAIRKVGLGGVSEQVKSLLTNAVIKERVLGPRWRRPVVRPGRRQREDHHYAMWANRYVWALAQPDVGRSPNSFIAAADSALGAERTPKYVGNRVAHCRNYGFLSRSTKGRAGGELTNRSIELLAELGIEPGADHLVDDDTTTEES